MAKRRETDQELYESALLQISAAHSTLWGAVADALIRKGVCDAGELQTLISSRMEAVTPDKDGGFYRGITERAMRAIPQAIEGLMTEGGEHG